MGDTRVQKILNKITSLKSLALPPVCLPDLHLKERTEAPSSFAAATQNTIVPELTAPSVGCGMGIVATALSVNDMNHHVFEKFYKEIRSNLGPKYGHLMNLLLWLGIIERPKNKYDISVEDFENIIKRGAKAAVQIYDLPEDTLRHIEYGGEINLVRKNLKNILPRISYRSGRHDLGYGFKGNHFLEIQCVERVLDETKAQEWGLVEKQILVMYHGGGGAVSYHIGRYFANRKKNTFKQKILLLFFKILFHFGDFAHWQDFSKRLRYYFLTRPFTEVPLDSREGKRLFEATKASLNYSYGFRIAMVRRIIDSLEKIVPEKDTHAKLLWDSTHNAVMEEEINNKKVVVHRHTANRVFEDKPVIVSGFNTTSSYIAVGLRGAEEHLFASDHGAGITISRAPSQEHPKSFVTHIYQTRPPYKKVVEHVTNEGIDYVMQKLEEYGIARPVVELRPLAVFKG